MPEKESVNAFRGMRFPVGLTLATYSWMWSCFFLRVSLDRNLAATVGSDSRPYEKASLHALPIAPTPAKITALAVFEKVELEDDLEYACIYLATLPA